MLSPVICRWGSSALLILLIIYIGVFRPRRINTYTIPNNKHYDENPERLLDLIKSFDEIPYEEIWIKSYDNKKLFGRLYLSNKMDDFAICIHGYNGNGIRDFSGGGTSLIKEGYNVLVIDHRGQGKSKGGDITFGIKERRDVLSWVNYINERFPGRDISLYGVSMGASTVLYASTLGLKNVKRIIADSPYSSIKDEVKYVIKNILKLPIFPFYQLVYLSALLFSHIRINKIDAKDIIKDTKIPILIIHGTDDDLVPEYMSKDLPLCNELVERVTFDGAGHVLSFIKDNERYNKVVHDFISRTK